ncbi:CHAP domain-containing protein [Streptosporangium sp. NPDC048047]|uniref:CHAP domain-containing protein n=1 Tax=Streptosporangium sp. NPDC048047 TaxID=3155748 RepID=UPI00342C6733
MDPIGDALLKTMAPELGYRQRDGQPTVFGRWYSANVVRDAEYETAPWCDMFISWAAAKAGVADYVGLFAWTPSHARWFATHGAWSGTPEPGALVFFDWSGGRDIGGIDHVGVVERVDGGTIHTIEANVDGSRLKRKTRDESKVVGYGLPRKVRENLAGARPADGAGALSEATRIEVRPAPGPGASSLAFGTGPYGMPPETAPVAGLLAVLLVATFLLTRRRSRPAAGRHRRRDRRPDSVAPPPPGSAGPGDLVDSGDSVHHVHCVGCVGSTVVPAGRGAGGR